METDKLLKGLVEFDDIGDGVEEEEEVQMVEEYVHDKDYEEEEEIEATHSSPISKAQSKYLVYEEK